MYARISIHAPREGSDRPYRVQGLCSREFQSTLPVRGATPGERFRWTMLDISIHAPREGSDQEGVGWVQTLRNFNPRSP